MDYQLRDTLKIFWQTHGSGGDGNQEGVVGGGISREQKTASDYMRQVSSIGDRQHSGEQRTLYIGVVLVKKV